MITPDCYAHQVCLHSAKSFLHIIDFNLEINLIVGDYFKVNQGFLKYSTLATELITWLRSKTFLLALIREVQKEKGLRVITVIRAVITRWTAHYLAYRHLLELQSTLKFLAAEDEMLSPKEKRVVTGDVKAWRRANMMLGIINDPLFWCSLARYVCILFLVPVY
ncbi:hypothetical protein EDD18DRAFT_1065782 [Armillaria luteobubalina]|uniref:Uncharacterized protein n=1 Tax=Armillaria luteobubalina TaxID=153913 RepID=A0AA39QFH8_9AGAR|nr:hypothetical protein EDD18DRAFT_1065782 [Armillaria luteobubalina]